MGWQGFRGLHKLLEGNGRILCTAQLEVVKVKALGFVLRSVSQCVECVFFHLESREFMLLGSQYVKCE